MCLHNTTFADLTPSFCLSADPIPKTICIKRILGSHTAAIAAGSGVVDQGTQMVLGDDITIDERGVLQEMKAPSFNSLCNAEHELWAQTLTVGMTGSLYSVELMLLRRFPDVVSPVQVEIRSVDAAGLPTTTVLGRGTTTTVIPFHASVVSCQVCK